MEFLKKNTVGSMQYDDAEMSHSPNLSPSKRRRSIATQKVIESNIEENDDEAERMARRERSDGSSPSTWASGCERRQSTFGLSAISGLSASEMSNQIAQCIKLSAENKINDKNAFQLKMIDFLVYTLKKQDPNMTNLQMASASLDASAKIYGFRVDKVHSDLLKIIGMCKQDKKDDDQNNGSEHDTDLALDKNEAQMKKRKRNRSHIISSSEALRGHIETYDPSLLATCQREAQTSDLLFQASLPQHELGTVALNLYNDVILDKVQYDHLLQLQVISSTIAECNDHSICHSYSVFKFVDWSPDNEEEESESFIDEVEGDYHFDLDAAVLDENKTDNGIVMDWEDKYEERCEKSTPLNRIENIIDFQDMIANNPNPNATYEYSYLQKSYRIHWAGPSHWKITLHKCSGASRVIETCKQNAVRKKREIDLCFTIDIKREDEIKFDLVNRQTKLTSKTTKSIWSEEKVTFPQQVLYDSKPFHIFFNKPSENSKVDIDDQLENHDSHGHFLAEDSVDENLDFAIPNDQELRGIDTEADVTSRNHAPDSNLPIVHHHGAFVGDNLVSIPKLTDRIFIPYSQRAKKVDMRQLKKAIWKNLKMSLDDRVRDNPDNSFMIKCNDIELGENGFTNLYSKLPRMLSKVNVDSLSPAIAFVSLLHIANEKNLAIKRNHDLSDLIVSMKEICP
ncbi:hypothetical protein QAD02_021762 [Eretmocerus hayati]|uniref:Uncharacterized protein n=1 Tax=Eretmocerus hayati TaxID=131215 RepID=A0ACC2PTM3_9HYME|nr:hypothetical protein QAD02_021762 [Eretmocerus hayati]